MSVELFRMLVIMLPASVLVYHFAHKEHDIKKWVGGLFAHIWQFQWRLILLGGGVQLGLWQFTVQDMLLLNVPSDIILGCGLLLGFLPRIVAPWFPIMGLMVVDGLISFSLLSLTVNGLSVFLLALVSVIVIVPSHLLARWSEHDKHLYLRSVLQNTSWAILLLFTFPSIIFNLTNDSWEPLLQRTWMMHFVYLTPMMIPAVLLLNALYEFAVRGKGTAFPYDAPKYLVTTGVYAYLSNPMQLGIVLMMALWGLVLQSYLIALSAVVAFVLFIVFKNVCNGSCQLGVTDPNWMDYQSKVPKWLPKKPLSTNPSYFKNLSH